MKIEIVDDYRDSTLYAARLSQDGQSFRFGYRGSQPDCRYYAKMFRRALKAHDAEQAKMFRRALKAHDAEQAKKFIGLVKPPAGHSR